MPYNNRAETKSLSDPARRADARYVRRSVNHTQQSVPSPLFGAGPFRKMPPSGGIFFLSGAAPPALRRTEKRPESIAFGAFERYAISLLPYVAD